MPRGIPKNPRKPRNAPLAHIVERPAKPVREYKSPMDIVHQMESYREASEGKNRGLFEDCKADIYRLFMLDYNDWRLKEVKATGMSDRVYHEWRQRFVRAFGTLEQAA